MFNRYEEAERDCTQAISLDGSYAKAFARRGTARTFLGKITEAKQGKAIITHILTLVRLLEAETKISVTSHSSRIVNFTKHTGDEGEFENSTFHSVLDYL